MRIAQVGRITAQISRFGIAILPQFKAEIRALQHCHLRFKTRQADCRAGFFIVRQNVTAPVQVEAENVTIKYQSRFDIRHAYRDVMHAFDHLFAVFFGGIGKNPDVRWI